VSTSNRGTTVITTKEFRGILAAIDGAIDDWTSGLSPVQIEIVQNLFREKIAELDSKPKRGRPRAAKTPPSETGTVITETSGSGQAGGAESPSSAPIGPATDGVKQPPSGAAAGGFVMPPFDDSDWEHSQAALWAIAQLSPVKPNRAEFEAGIAKAVALLPVRKPPHALISMRETLAMAIHQGRLNWETGEIAP
jgi:hypothetical protein